MGSFIYKDTIWFLFLCNLHFQVQGKDIAFVSTAIIFQLGNTQTTSFFYLMKSLSWEPRPSRGNQSTDHPR